MSKELPKEAKEKIEEMADRVVGAITPPPNLRQKLATVRKDLEFIKARGRNDFHKYDYVKAADVQGIVGEKLAAVGVVIGMRNMVIARLEAETANSRKENVIEFHCEYGYLDADSSEELWYPAIGEGRDSGDKAVYKARTGAFKYFLTQSLCLGLGDDPEETGDEDHERGSTGAKPKAHASKEPTPYQQVHAKKITPEQRAELDALILQSADPDATAVGICEHFAVTELADMSSPNANVAITILKTKLAKAAKEPSAASNNA